MANLRIGLRASMDGGPEARAHSLAKMKLAEQLGYDILWLDETWGEDVITHMNEVVAATSTIKVGGLVNVFSRSPGVIASSFATLDERSGGRIVLSLATSGANVIEHFHGVPYEKSLRRLREYVDIINMLVRGERLIYDGEIFHMSRGFRLQVPRARDHIPVFIAAISPRSIEQTGEIADGIIPIHWPKDRYDSLRQRIAKGAAKAGKKGTDVEITPYLTVGYVTDESQRAAVTRQAKQPVAWYIGRMGVFYKQMLAREGYAAEVPVIEAAWERGQDAAIDAVPDAMNANIAFVGTPQELHKQFVDLTDHGIDVVNVTMPRGTYEEAAPILEALIKG